MRQVEATGCVQLRKASPRPRGKCVVAAIIMFTVCFLCHGKGKLLAAPLKLDFRSQGSALAVPQSRSG